jgi:hypothetical protein
MAKARHTWRYGLMGVLAAIIFWSFGYIIRYANNTLDVKLFSWNISYWHRNTFP